MKRCIFFVIISMFLSVSLSFAGGWDKSKGMEKITLKGTLLCIGCNLKRLSGANAQCSLYTHHAIGFRTEDGTIWNILENAKGHDIVRAYKLLDGRKATITGWIYPIAHVIEIDKIVVDDVKMEDIQKAAWEEDQDIAKALMSRKIGESPIVGIGH